MSSQLERDRKVMSGVTGYAYNENRKIVKESSGYVNVDKNRRFNIDPFEYRIDRDSNSDKADPK